MAATLWRLLGMSTPKPDIHEGDDVYPVHFLDETPTLRGILVTWTLRFNDVLDPDKLHDALAKLLDIGDWRKMGGRLRLKENGSLEIHVPRPFTKERPGVFYTHQTISTKIEEHHVAKNLPSATSRPQVHAGARSFQTLAIRAGHPSAIEEYIASDLPQLSLHITSFHNATLVGLSWPHTAMDAMGQAALLQAWSLVLADRSSEVPQFLGAREDALIAATTNTTAPPEPLQIADKALTGWAMARFALNFARDLVWNRAVEHRIISLPAPTVARLVAQARTDLAAAHAGASAPFVSDSDVLTAWAVRAAHAALAAPRAITVLHPVNARFRLPALAGAGPGVYVQNMALAAYAFLTPEVLGRGLGAVALANRVALAAQTTEGQMLAQIRHLAGAVARGLDPARFLCGSAEALLMPFTNWGRADVAHAADFAAAVVRRGMEAPRADAPGRIAYHHAGALRDSPMVRNVVVFFGTDHAGNAWVNGSFTPAMWVGIEREVERLQSQG